MSDTPQTQPPGWYYAEGDPPGTQRYWDGSKWEGGPQPVPGSQGDVGIGGPSLAEPINRIGARLIDGVIWFVINAVVFAVFVGGSAFSTGGASYVTGLFAGLVSTALIAGYEIFMVGSRGQTLGKMALGMKVTREDGSAPDFQVAAMRMAHYIALAVLAALTGVVGIIFNLVLLVIVIVSLVFLFSDNMRQTVWDKVAKTLVVTT